MSDLARSLALWWLLAALAAAQRFATIGPTPTLSPRYYQAASPFNPLGKRQAQCEEGHHPCLDIGSLGATSCCPDDTYCIVDPSTGNKAACCAIGSVCGSSCSEDQYQCNATTTLTSPTRTVTTVAACCPRPCDQTSRFLCPAALGGGCCSFGQNCASGRKCLWTSTAAPTSFVAQAPAGCTTSQIACASDLGGGCCADTQRCTRGADGSASCASASVQPTASGVSAVPRRGDGGGGGLSGGAKAGIAIGVVAGSGLVVGFLTWMCLRQRRRERARATMGGSDGIDIGTMSETAAGTATATRMAGSGGGRRRDDGSYSAAVGRAGEMSDTHSDIASQGGRLRGLTQDYSGPDAVAGPFTETGGYDGSMPATLSGRARAVPTEPHGPDDITAPVEIDSQTRDPTTVERSVSVGSGASVMPPQPVTETIDGRFELYASELPAAGAVSWFPPGAGFATVPEQPSWPHAEDGQREGSNAT